MITYELAKKLKDAGFPQKTNEYVGDPGFMQDGQYIHYPYYPTLSELIEAIDPYYITLAKESKNRTPEGYLKFSGWKASCSDADDYWIGEGETAETAVANLWLNIQNPELRAKTAVTGVPATRFVGQCQHCMCLDRGPASLNINGKCCWCGIIMPKKETFDCCISPYCKHVGTKNEIK